MRNVFVVSLASSAALSASAFLPWLHLGDVGLAGVPDPAGYFVAGVGAIGVLLSATALLRHRDMRQGLILVGIAGLTTLLVVWMTGPSTIAARAQAHAEAVALVDNVAVQPPPPVGVGPGLLAGVVASVAVAVSGLAGRHLTRP